jgi:sporulation protein YlmC with PRC-barrel domain
LIVPPAGVQEAIIPEQAETQIRALMGTKVVGPGGEEIGKVEDPIFDENEKITCVVVDIGGFLGIGKKEVGLNWDQAEPESLTHVCELSADGLRSAPFKGLIPCVLDPLSEGSYRSSGWRRARGPTANAGDSLRC